MKKIYKLILIVVSFFCTSFVERYRDEQKSFLDKKEGEDLWVENVFQKLTLKQKIGQLFMVAAYTTQDYRENVALMEEMINEYEVGGIIFMKGKVYRQIELTNYYQSISKIPLMFAIDAEWGLEMRLDNTFRFPWNLTLGAIENNNVVRNVGEAIGRHCREIGVHINFAPDVDLNTNYKNPIIGNRSFGEDKVNAYKKGLHIIKGMESNKVMSVIKHFPGHGDTEQDSHKSLPSINKSKTQIYSEEIYP